MMKMEYLGKCLLINEGKEKILCVGDLHLGYEGVLNKSGVFVSRQMFKEMINYFDKVFEKTGNVDKIILLGDVKHEIGSIMKQEWNDVLGLIRYLGKKLSEDGEIIVVKGNHDKILEPILRNIEIPSNLVTPQSGISNRHSRTKDNKINGNVYMKEVVLKDCYVLGDFCFMHGDRDFLENYDKKIKYWVLGHGHPAIKISEPGGVKVEKYKCFLEGRWKGKKIIIVPSFFSANEGSDARENNLGMVWKFDYNKFNVKVVSGRGLEVLDFGILSKL